MSHMEPPTHSSGGGVGLLGVIGKIWKKEKAIVVYNRKTGWYDNITFGLYPLPQLRTLGVYRGDISKFKVNDEVIIRLKKNATLPEKLSLSIGVALSSFSNIEYIEKVVDENMI